MADVVKMLERALEYQHGARPTLTMSGQPDSRPSSDSHPSSDDTWFTRIWSKFGLDTSASTSNLNESSRTEQKNRSFRNEIWSQRMREKKPFGEKIAEEQEGCVNGGERAAAPMAPMDPPAMALNRSKGEPVAVANDGK
ncbi:hypothetical protein L1887_03967 [Cichorium endivia]|nr:hypothetical protein L1887_03967 [Cichorium endivia]